MERAIGFSWDFFSVATLLSVVLLVLSRPCLLSSLVDASFPDLFSKLALETKELESKLLLVIGRLVDAFVPSIPCCVGRVVDFSLAVGELKSKFFVLREDVLAVWRRREVTTGGPLVEEPLLLVKLVDDTIFDEERLELGAVVVEPRLDLSELLPVSRLVVRPVLPDCVNGVVEVVSCLEPRRLWLLVVDDLSDDPCSRDERGVSLGGLVELDSNRTELGVTFDLELLVVVLELRMLVVWDFSDDPEDSNEAVCGRREAFPLRRLDVGFDRVFDNVNSDFDFRPTEL